MLDQVHPDTPFDNHLLRVGDSVASSGGDHEPEEPFGKIAVIRGRQILVRPFSGGPVQWLDRSELMALPTLVEIEVLKGETDTGQLRLASSTLTRLDPSCRPRRRDLLIHSAG